MPGGLGPTRMSQEKLKIQGLRGEETRWTVLHNTGEGGSRPNQVQDDLSHEGLPHPAGGGSVVPCTEQRGSGDESLTFVHNIYLLPIGAD